MLPSSVLIGLYVGLDIIVLGVVLLALNIVVRQIRCRKFGNNFILALGMLIGWLGTLLIRGWFGYYLYQNQQGIDVQWMLNHYMIAIGIVLIAIGGLLHIRTLSQASVGNLGWIGFTIAALGAYALFV